uniref:Cyclotide n=1 Tax=Clitoria ternatea TaxID=43366 RepID=A0A7G5F398_CLITE|nr:cyclotide precursor [Clitoria ternatea]
MAYVRLTSLPLLFFIAASVMLTVQKTEGGNPIVCGETCFFQKCYTPGCSCDAVICTNNHIIATKAKTDIC